MEHLMELNIAIREPHVVKGKTMDICMIDFTGTTQGPHFTGKVIGTGVDTQKIRPGQPMFLSARYMLEGDDAVGNPCKIFIENNGDDFDNCKPMIITDSPLLQEWEEAELKATVTPVDRGVTINIYKL
ncbi:MAG: DUF3237 domain-containing protein [Lachnospiraceae bacterium]|nr:DUF3237 family protein [Lachnospiraceae bacterium]MCR5354971.1 DUF3237 domain-containing protein [Lachnospiraceae bacterium]